MKTAISIPDELFRRAEQLAKQRKVHRSALYAQAVREYLERQSSEEITRKLDEIYGNTLEDEEPLSNHVQQKFFSRDW